MAIPPIAATTKLPSASDSTKLPPTTASQRRSIGDQGGGVVEQRLALDQGPDDARRPEPAEHARGGQGIGRPDDGTEGERARPAETRDDRVRDHGHDDHGEDHQPERQPDERGEVGAELADRRFDGGREQQRRQEDQQHQVGLERDPGQAGDQRQAEPTEDEQGWIWHADPTRDLEQDRDRHERGQDRAQDLHWRMLWGPGNRSPRLTERRRARGWGSGSDIPVLGGTETS